MFNQHRIAVVGAGGIGRAVGLILAEKNEFPVKIYIGDANGQVAKEAAEWIIEGCGDTEVVFPFTMPMEGTSDEMIDILKNCEVVLDCLPGSQAPRIARLAKEYDLHYANLTEYVKETNEVVEIAKDAKQGFILQTGLAPGFINVLGNQLFQHFCQQHGVKQVDKLSMKVGALTRHAAAPHFYGFTWSPVGVATEYIKDCVAVRNGKKVFLPALSEPETIIIDGVTYRDNLTSGGAADLPEALAGRVKTLDYKTLRYPGHYHWVKQVLSVIPEEENKVDRLQDIMQAFIPMVEDDVVIVYAAVQGKDQKGMLRGIQSAYRIEPTWVGTKKLRAIQTTTAAPLAEAARMLLSGKWSGPVFQSQIDPQEFMNGPFVWGIYGQTPSKEPVAV
ncbi:MAG: saccharopine dehydrogenase C-terminal domain-containing protein [Bacteroidota bacterium]